MSNTHKKFQSAGLKKSRTSYNDLILRMNDVASRCAVSKEEERECVCHYLHLHGYNRAMVKTQLSLSGLIKFSKRS